MLSLALSNEEKELFEIINKSLLYKGKTTTARVAGGWVRDKLLGLESDDIDIALDDLSGVEFAHSVNEYLQNLGKDVRTIAVIQANPDQSKHLETANLRVLGFEIDCVNLRAETYTTESRIPVIQFGCPLDDALRRDFTINSLFYNLKTQEIEDLTNLGIRDLTEGIIRTPISPMITFHDDPLRILRAVRFSCRYNYQLHEDIIAAAQNIDIQKALCEKVSRERILKELEGISSPRKISRPFMAIKTLYELNLFDAVFMLPSNTSFQINSQMTLKLEQSESSQENIQQQIFNLWKTLSLEISNRVNILLSLTLEMYHNDYKILSLGDNPASFIPTTYSNHQINVSMNGMKESNALSNGDNVIERIRFMDINHIYEIFLTHSKQIPSLYLEMPKISESIRILFWCCCVTGLQSLQVIEKKKLINLYYIVLRDSLKIDNETLKQVHIIFDFIIGFQQLVHDYSIDDSNRIQSEDFREAAGMILRSCKSLWRMGILLTCAHELVQFSLNTIVHSLVSSANTIKYPIFTDLTLSDNDLKTIFKYVKFQTVIEELGLDECWLMKPLLDGHVLKDIAGGRKGPIIGQLMEEQIKWQLRYPNGGPNDCVVHLQQLISQYA